MGTALLSFPAAYQPPGYGSKTSLGFSSSRGIRFFSSSSFSPSVLNQETNSPPPHELPIQSESDPDPDGFSFRGCKACGREEIERGCNGEGRIQGGIATVPGFGWWPIKAYRPCPGFIASGGRYKRRGQSMDEVASGGTTKTSQYSSKKKSS